MKGYYGDRHLMRGLKIDLVAAPVIAADKLPQFVTFWNKDVHHG